MSNQRKTVTVEEASRKCGTKADLHRGMRAVQYLMPSLSSGICTVEWMHAVRQGTYWCPKMSELQPRNCTRPPPKPLVLAELRRLLRERRMKPFGPEGHEPDRAWALTCLACLQPEHEFFQPGYRPPTKVKPGEEQQKPMRVYNGDGLFDQLPEPDRKRQRKGQGRTQNWRKASALVEAPPDEHEDADPLGGAQVMMPQQPPTNRSLDQPMMSTNLPFDVNEPAVRLHGVPAGMDQAVLEAWLNKMLRLKMQKRQKKAAAKNKAQHRYQQQEEQKLETNQ